MNKISLVAAALAAAASLPAQWSQATPSPDIAGRIGAGMTYDPTTGTMLMFGGDLATSPFGGPFSNETWRYDGASWQLQSPAASPPAASGVELVYDSNRGVFVTYGAKGSGPFGGPAADRTWEYDGVTWTEVFPTTTPGGLCLYGMCFDSARNRVVLHGGEINGGILIFSSDTWEYDGTNWSLATPAHSPGLLERPAMCFHAGLGVSVLFGGIDPFVGGTDKVWLYDGIDWSEAAIAGTRPAVRTGCRIVYDDVRQLCVMTGGVDPNNGTPFTDTWELDLVNLTWTQIPTSYSQGRRDFCCAFDSNRRQVVMTGGIGNGFAPIGGTYEYGARSIAFGNGCLGSNGVPALSAVAAPHLGANYTLDVANLNPAINLAVMVLSASEIPGGIALDFLGMTGCTGYVVPDTLVTIAGAAGSASWTIAVPATTSLTGADLFAQALSIDPINPAWLVASNAHRGVLGS